MAKWLQLVDKYPPPFVEWKDEEEDRLLKLKSKNIDIEDTALGRAKKTVQREMEVQFGSMPAEAQLDQDCRGATEVPLKAEVA